MKSVLFHNGMMTSCTLVNMQQSYHISSLKFVHMHDFWHCLPHFKRSHSHAVISVKTLFNILKSHSKKIRPIVHLIFIQKKKSIKCMYECCVVSTLTNKGRHLNWSILKVPNNQLKWTSILRKSVTKNTGIRNNLHVHWICPPWLNTATHASRKDVAIVTVPLLIRIWRFSLEKGLRETTVRWISRVTVQLRGYGGLRRHNLKIFLGDHAPRPS